MEDLKKRMYKKYEDNYTRGKFVDGAFMKTICNHCGKDVEPLHFDYCGNPSKRNSYGFGLIIKDVCCDDMKLVLEPFRKEFVKKFFEMAINSINEKSTPKIYQHLKLADFKNNKLVYDKIKKMIDSYPDIKGLYAYSKNNGTGKTALSTVYAKVVCALSGFYRYKFLNYPEFVNKYEQLPFEDKGYYLNGFKKADLLVIDDLGKGRSTIQSTANIYDIVNHRINNEMIIICNSNLSLGEIGKQFDSSVASRLYEMCEIIDMKGKDLRLN